MSASPYSAPPTLRLPVRTLPQPDETTCGPTCLHAIYRYWGEREPISAVVERMWRMQHGGTFAVYLGCDALRKGYAARIYTCNLLVFDPTWFSRPQVDIAERLAQQREIKNDPASGRSDERMACQVFFIAGLLADQQDRRRPRPFAGDALRRVLPQRTTAASIQFPLRGEGNGCCGRFGWVVSAVAGHRLPRCRRGVTRQDGYWCRTRTRIAGACCRASWC